MTKYAIILVAVASIVLWTLAIHGFINLLEEVQTWTQTPVF